ncbi:MAG: hypothetical protein ABIS45_14625 [Burkholderiales bacterium]
MTDTIAMERTRAVSGMLARVRTIACDAGVTREPLDRIRTDAAG